MESPILLHSNLAGRMNVLLHCVGYWFVPHAVTVYAICMSGSHISTGKLESTGCYSTFVTRKETSSEQKCTQQMAEAHGYGFKCQ